MSQKVRSVCQSYQCSPLVVSNCTLCDGGTCCLTHASALCSAQTASYVRSSLVPIRSTTLVHTTLRIISTRPTLVRTHSFPFFWCAAHCGAVHCVRRTASLSPLQPDRSLRSAHPPTRPRRTVQFLMISRMDCEPRRLYVRRQAAWLVPNAFSGGLPRFLPANAGRLLADDPGLLTCLEHRSGPPSACPRQSALGPDATSDLPPTTSGKLNH